MDSPESLQRLWGDFAATRSLELRNQLVMHYIKLVKQIALRLVPTYRKHVDFDDLMSCGLLGLMDAIDRFDVTKEVKFETYATLRIKGEIIDQIRRQDWAPISLRQKIKRIEDGITTLEAKLGRSASEAEVAEYLSMSADEVRRALDESYTFNMVALDELLMDRTAGEGLLASQEYNPEERYEQEEVKQILARCVDALPEKERLVISMYYTDELTLKEIGAVLGVTESRVSQIHSKAIATLRVKMTAAFS
ncbi:MAG: FliA/WhiG family RNA polymerase sigma factor [Oscillospiraceae bacterium]|jgi:RNA polymerase sigma factor for flagellar operon FliA|nr:FliA/WhiG family RNA polymerase sigma factor [Oscillospiraceae bacterium]